MTKKAKATLENLRRVFTIPESRSSTLARIEQEISKNMQGFLNAHVTSGDAKPDDLEKDFASTVIEDDPIWVSEHADFLLEKVVSQSVHTSSPKFIGHMTSALPYFMLPLSKLMTALNQNVVKIETSKVFTPLERQVVGMMHRSFYNNDDSFYRRYTHNRNYSLGTFCSGGTIANLTALWAARNKLLAPKDNFKGIQKAGLFAALKFYGFEDIAILASERAHYSLLKSCDLLGLGHQNIVKIKTDSASKMDIGELKSKIKTLRSRNTAIISIVGVAGTTETGSVDPLHEIGQICRAENIHFHVDAAWGGPVIFSDKHRHKLAGIEMADSITIDAHKQMYVPVGAGIVLFKDPHLQNAISHNANYIIRKGSRDLGKMTVEGSRPGVSMLVHSAIKVFGRRGFELLIDLGIEHAEEFARLTEEHPEFEQISPVELNIFTYRYVPVALAGLLKTADRAQTQSINLLLNDLNVELQKKQRSAGNSFVSRTTLTPVKYHRQDINVLRTVLANPLTTTEILRDILEEQRMIGHQLTTGLFFDRMQKFFE